MRAAVFACDGATVPEEWCDLRRQELQSSGSAQNMNMRLESLVGGEDVHAEATGLDLVRIASYVYCADQAVNRGSERDVMLDDWRRDMRMCVPVSDPALWSEPGVTAALTQTLNFLSDDVWQFAFEQGPPDSPARDRQARFALAEKRPDVVALISGGLDSAASTFAACAEQGARPILVSHRPSPVVAHHQNAVVEHLKATFPHWRFPTVAPWINRSSGDAPDDTQRTRSFLFLAIASCVAQALQISKVLASDNGVMSLNIPINEQLVGARASRSTHPKFLWRFNQLSRAIWHGDAPMVENSLLFRTRQEAVEIVAKYAGPALIRETVSCQSPYRRDARVRHCGVCSQCVGRRFATLAAGLGDYDSPDGYNVDIFADELKDGVDVTAPVSFVRFAASVLAADAEQFWADHEEFGDAILPDDRETARTAGALMATLHRHADGVIRVMREQVVLHSEEIAVGTLPKRSLISLMGEAAAPSGVERGPVFSLSEDLADLYFRGKHYTLSQLEGQVIQFLYDQLVKKSPAVRTATLRQRLSLAPDHRFDHTFVGDNRNLWKREDSLVVGTSKRDVVRLNEAITAPQREVKQ